MSTEEIVLADKKFCFAIPAYDGKVVLETMNSLLETTNKLTQNNIAWSFITIKGNGLIDATRNELIARFLNETDADYMVWIDNDVSWDWEGMSRLLAWGVKFGYACGVYCSRTDPPKFAINAPKMEFDEYGLIELDGVGFGFVITSRKLLESLQVPEYFRKESDLPVKQYFSTAVIGNRYYGEDMMFCKLVKDQLGLSIKADPEIKLAHHGNKDFRYYFKDYLHLMMEK